MDLRVDSIRFQVSSIVKITIRGIAPLYGDPYWKNFVEENNSRIETECEISGFFLLDAARNFIEPVMKLSKPFGDEFEVKSNCPTCAKNT